MVILTVLLRNQQVFLKLIIVVYLDNLSVKEIGVVEESVG